MDVGQFTNADHTSFDLDALDETDSVITRSSLSGTHRTRWMYKDEQLQLVMLEKTETITSTFPRGTKLHVSRANGVAQPNQNNPNHPVVARLAIDIDFNNPGTLQQRTVTDNLGNQHLALLVPVIIS